MGRLLGYFGRGLVLLAPIAITVAVCLWLLSTVDDIILTRLDEQNPLNFPGVGVAITVVVITLVGFLGTNFITRSAIGLMDRMLDRLPVVRLLYGAVRDVINAFVGDNRRFDQPVSVRLDDAGGVRLFGFVTQQSLAVLAMPGHVSVYCPHSYNFSGQLVVVSSDRIAPLQHASSEVMAFIVSGGVAGVSRPAEKQGTDRAAARGASGANRGEGSAPEQAPLSERP